MKNKVSVVVPIYNAELYLTRCLESIRTQAYTDLEIICVNDGSTDGSLKIAKEFADKDSRFLVVNKENGGESSARNAGLRLVTGDYVTFIDNDDWIEPDMYMKMVNKIQDTGCDLVATGFYRDTDQQSERVKNIHEVTNRVFDKKELLSYVFKRDLYRGFAAYIWCKLFKRDILYREGESIIFDESLKIGGDIVFFTKAACQVEKACYIDEALYHYYQRDTSTYHSDCLDIQLDFICAYKDIISILVNDNADEETICYVKRFLVYHAMRIARNAAEQKNKAALLQAQENMYCYEKEYVTTNENHPERLAEYYKLRELK